MPPIPPQPAPPGTWVQTERIAHEAWAALSGSSPRAAQLMHLLTARVGEHNAVIISQRTLAGLMNVKSVNTVKQALAVLKAGRWIDIRQVGDNGTVNAYVLNRNVVWSGPRDGIRYALFSASVVISDQEQPDRELLDQSEPLRTLPTMYPGERQLPAGDGLPPPSQPSFPGLEPDQPAVRMETNR